MSSEHDDPVAGCDPLMGADSLCVSLNQKAERDRSARKRLREGQPRATEKGTPAPSRRQRTPVPATQKSTPRKSPAPRAGKTDSSPMIENKVTPTRQASAREPSAVTMVRAQDQKPDEVFCTPVHLASHTAPFIEEPLTATQEAEAAEDYVPPSPPPMFSLRSVSNHRAEPTAEAWKADAKAFFHFIDERKLSVAE